jgi:hypothetical protein
MPINVVARGMWAPLIAAPNLAIPIKNLASILFFQITNSFIERLDMLDCGDIVSRWNGWRNALRRRLAPVV